MIALLKKLLHQNLYGHLTDDFEDIFLSHPNYPSLFAVTDSLNTLAIENIAVKVPKEYLMELPDLFLAIFNEEMVLVSKKSTSLTIETKEKQKNKLSFGEFSLGWDGVIIAVEPNSEVIENAKPSEQVDWLRYILPLAILISLSVYSNDYDFYSLILLVTTLGGLFISVLIVREKLGLKNDSFSKLCNLSSNASCDTVIKSDKSTITKWVDFSDLPLLFFGISLLAILISPKYSSAVIGIISVASIPVILYSVWLQKFQLKKWCALCLIVSFVIVLQSVFGVINNAFFLFLEVDFTVFLFSTVLFSSLWLAVKPVLEEKNKAAKEVVELKKFKRNYAVFSFLNKEIPMPEGFNHLEGIHFGNRHADVHLTIILSPTCGHCHTAFRDAIAMSKKYPEKLFLNVLFNVNPENNDNPYRSVVQHLLAINYQNPEKTEQAISDWHIANMPLDKWTEKWGMNSVDMKVTQQLYQQYSWCLQNNFNYTPVKIINGKQFPNQYNISELRYFFSDFSKENEIIGDAVLM